MEKEPPAGLNAALHAYILALQADPAFQEARQQYMPFWLTPVPARPAGAEETSRRVALTPDHALEHYHALVLLGEAGAGKSCLLRRLALEQAEALLGQGERGPPAGRVAGAEAPSSLPFYVDLSTYRGGPIPGLLVEILRRHGLPQADLPTLEAISRGHALLLLFDGNDPMEP